MKVSELQVSVSDLLPHPGKTKRIERQALLDDLAVSGSRVPNGEPVRLDLELQALNDSIIAVGDVRVAWTGECRRCLKTVVGELVAPVQEIYERDPAEGETRKLAGESVDLTELARDAVLLELPVAPLCTDDCAGLCPVCGIDRNTATCECETDEVDPRWAGLSDLTFE